MELLQEIETLYNQGLSMSEVANKLGINMWRVRSLMKWHKIPRRTASESNKIRFSKTPLSYQKLNTLSKNEENLYIAGTMLYWAEGSKRNKHSVDLANSDANIALLFLKMLRKIYHVNEKKLRIYLYCYSNQNPANLITYWSNLLQIPPSQFTKPYVRSDYNENSTHKMEHGLVHIRYADMRLLMDIKQNIDIIYSRLIS